MPSQKSENYRIPIDNHTKKRVTPKFTSFSGIKTKPATAVQAIREGHTHSEERRHEDQSQGLLTQSPDASGPSLSRHHSKRNRDHVVEAERIRRTPQGAVRRATSHLEGSAQSYVIDKSGDPNNLVFGALHQYATPSYFRFGAGKVLGPLAGRKIDRASSSQKGIVLSYAGNHQWRRGDRKALWSTAGHASKELRVKSHKSHSQDIEGEVDFVSLQAAKRVKRRQAHIPSDSESSSNSDGERTHYRSVGGMEKAERHWDDEYADYRSDISEVSGGKDHSASSLEKLYLDKRRELSGKVEGDPTDYNAWLDFIEHQNNVPGMMNNPNRNIVMDTKQKGSAEMKLSLYEKALGKVKGPDGRDILLLGKMSEAAKVWDSQRLASEWQHILRDNPTHLTLWKEYLNYRQTTFASFQYEEVRTIYISCMTLLQTIRATSSPSIAEEDQIYEVQIYVVLRMTLFMRESGFPEQAVAVWQAILEFEFFRPSDFDSLVRKGPGSLRNIAISNFEQFWDSEVARIGEVGCEGWNKFHYEKGRPPPPKKDILESLVDSKSLWSSWVTSEHIQSQVARSPARTIDDVVEDDPYRVILFSDIRDFLIDSPSIMGRYACINGFLEFCHLPPLSKAGVSDNARRWWREGYLRNEALHSMSSTSISMEAQSPKQEGSLPGSHESSVRDNSKPPGMFKLPASDYQLSSDTLFADPRAWFSAFDTWCPNVPKEREPLDKTWVVNALQQLTVIDSEGDDLAEYLLALELRFSPGTVKKTARSLLRKRPSSLQLYNAYALIEYHLANPSKGENALRSAIKLGKTLDESTNQDSVILWHTWLWQRLRSEDPHQAFELMLRYGDGEIDSDILSSSPFSNHDVQPAMLLRTERAFEGTRDHSLALSQYKHAESAIDCLILFHYLKNGSSLPAAISIFKSNCLHLSTYTACPTSTQELIHQSFARLLYYHTTHTNLVKPSDIRTLLAESINLFPQNTIFLSLYAWNEARFRIDDRVRSIVKDVVLTENQDPRRQQQESVIPHFFAVHSEMNRSVTLGSNASTIRSTFERGVQSEGGAHCAGLWKMYFLYEQSRGDMGKAKSVFWRAIRACPWAKQLYLLPFEHLSGEGGFSHEDLRGVYELMGQKEIRVHVSLEDIFDAMDERGD